MLNNTLSSKIAVHYPFHPLAGRELEIVAVPRRPDLPVTVRDTDGADLKIPRWMTQPASADISISNSTVIAFEALFAVDRLVSAPSPLIQSRDIADPSLQERIQKSEGSDGATDIQNDAGGTKTRGDDGGQSHTGDRRSPGDVDGTHHGRGRSQRKGGGR